MTKIRFLFTLLFFLTVLAIYLNQENDLQSGLRLAENSYMDNISITQTNDGIVKWVLDAGKAVFVGDNEVKLEELRITFPEKELVLTSEGGLYDVARRDLEISGNINASTKDFDIVAKRLFWDSSRGELVSDEKVKIVGKRFSVEGGRLEAASGKARLRNNVRAVFNGK